MIMRYTREQLSQMKGLTDWDRLEKLTDEEMYPSGEGRV